MFINCCACSVCSPFVEKSRELEVAVFWRDRRAMCAVKLLRLEDMMDNQDHNQEFPLEPQGLLHAKVHATTSWCLQCWNVTEIKNYLNTCKWTQNIYSKHLKQYNEAYTLMQQLIFPHNFQHRQVLNAEFVLIFKWWYK